MKLNMLGPQYPPRICISYIQARFTAIFCSSEHTDACGFIQETSKADTQVTET